MFMTHLDCSLTGERYDADRLHNLSRAGKPLLARYDLGAVKRVLTRDVLAGRTPGMWKWRELLPLPEGAEAISLGEPRAVGACSMRPSAHGAGAVGQGRRSLPSDLSSAGLIVAVSMASISA